MRGEVVFLYAFDVADELLTARLPPRLLNQSLARLLVHTGHTAPREVPLIQPWSLELPPLQPLSPLPLAGAGPQVRRQVRLYDVGVISILLRVDFTIATLTDLHAWHRPRLPDGRSFDAVAQEVCDLMRTELEPYIAQPTSATAPEAYTVFCFTDLDGETDAARWGTQHRRPVAGLLTETPPELLSDMQVNEVWRISRSFGRADLAVIDWDAALLVDLEGYVDDALFVLELANLQLEEFRALDQRLDRDLDHLYQELGRRPNWLTGGSGAKLRTLRRYRIDLAKLSDEVTHITKFLGDWHLALVYLGARDRFHLDHWRQSVGQRLSQLDDLYSVAHSEMNERRMLWLEAAIVVLFILDVALILWGHR